MRSILVLACVLLIFGFSIQFAMPGFHPPNKCKYCCRQTTPWPVVPHCPEFDRRCYWGKYQCGLGEELVCIGSRAEFAWCCPRTGRICGWKCLLKQIAHPDPPHCPPFNNGKCEWRKYQCDSNQVLVCIGRTPEFAWCCDKHWP